MESKKLIFVSGKGGTGKSTISLLLAKQLALRGRKVLLVEMGRRSSAMHLAQLPFTPQFAPRSTLFGFDCALLDGKQCLEDYIGYYVRMETLASLFLNNKFMRALIPLAPGLDDLAVLGKLTSGIRGHGPPLAYDNIVVDSPSTGAFLSMLKSPLHLSSIVSMGPLNYHSKKILEVLSDSNLCHYVFLTLLESFPIEELEESTRDFYRTFKVNYSVVINRVIPATNTDTVKPEAFKNFLADTYRFQRDFLGHLTDQFGELGKQEVIKKPLVEVLQEGEYCHSLIN